MQTAPAASRPYLELAIQGAGRLLNVQAQMAHAPAVLASYTGMRRALAEHAKLTAKTQSALRLAASAVEGGAYALAVNTLLARRAGWNEEDISRICMNAPQRDAALEALLAVAREAVSDAGGIRPATWRAAREAGWTETELTEVYAHTALVTFIGRFASYAETEVDVAQMTVPS
jgi:hypothetical protein